MTINYPCSIEFQSKLNSNGVDFSCMSYQRIDFLVALTAHSFIETFAFEKTHLMIKQYDFSTEDFMREVMTC